MRAKFRGSSYELVLTEHAKLQMELRSVREADMLEVIETGKVKAKAVKGKFWVFKELDGRNDNLVAIAVSIEAPHLIVITAMVNWRPQ